jgi:alanyl-tRNA synthetase
MSPSTDEIRETFLEFFASEGHLRVPSASLVPADYDPSVLFTVAGMVPFKPYFLGQETPQRPRLTDCQKVFRTPDIELIGTTARHLTFFEMLGNFSFGDYFKREAQAFAWRLSTEGFGLSAQDIWVTVFAGDDALGIGSDTEAIDYWLEIGVPRDRIVECDREENWWQMGPTGPCGPDSELYLDRGLDFGAPDDLPGGENARFLEFWNLVFMQYDQNPEGVLTPLPAQSIDTGLGLNRMACMLQGKETVFETDQFAPLIALGEELSDRRYGEAFTTDKALRVLADHSRAVSFLLADGVVPSNEDRGYVLRRIMRRAIQHGRSLGLGPGTLGRYADIVAETMGGAYPELHAQRDLIVRWIAAEEESFGRTLEQGLTRLDELIARAHDRGDEGIAAADAFQLHDTYGFPIDMTLEIVTEHDLGVDEQGFEVLMDQQRARGRSGARGGTDARREAATAFSGQSGFATEFVGYETDQAQTTIGAVRSDGSDPAHPLFVKLRESPFYATGGGQVADTGVLECDGGGCRARVADVIRLGSDQVLILAPEHGSFQVGGRVHAHVDRGARHATAANHTATHLLHAALRARLGDHVHQAGSYVGPDKLRFDFTHAKGLSAEELADVTDEVNRRILESLPVRALTTTLDEARTLGAMALFNEKYGEIVRMVEVGDGGGGGGEQDVVSRELCGGIHVRNTAEIGLLRITTETSSAANVRRIEAITGPEAVALMRAHDRELETAAQQLRVPAERVAESVVQLRERVRELEREVKRGGGTGDAVDLDALAAGAKEIDGARVLTAVVAAADGDALLALADRLKGALGEAAIVLGRGGDGRVDLLASVAPALVARGVRAGSIIQTAAVQVGGGGGGRDTMARAGGRDPDKLPAAMQAAEAAIEAALHSQ